MQDPPDANRFAIEFGRAPDHEVVFAHGLPVREGTPATVELEDGTVVPRLALIAALRPIEEPNPEDEDDEGLAVQHAIEIEFSEDGTVRVVSHRFSTSPMHLSIPLDYGFDVRPWLRSGVAALMAQARTDGVGAWKIAEAPNTGSEQFLRRVHELYGEGRTLGEIGQLYGRSVSAASRWYSKAVTELGLDDQRPNR